MIGLSAEQKAIMAEKQKFLLSDLGKATMRGVRKCPKCGIANGTRGITCKNKSCDYVFKECPEKKKVIMDSVKLITGTASQIYSVRVRDRGPDYRGFVQLPLIQGFDGTTDQIEDTSLLTQTTAKCFVETCLKSKQEDSDGLSLSVEPCQHIHASMNCLAEAEMLTLKNSVLTGLQVSDEMRQNVWKLATETPGPLVQRVSKTVMAVKCKEDSRNPLGFLHFTFDPSNNRDESECKFHCSCKDFKTKHYDITYGNLENNIVKPDIVLAAIAGWMTLVVRLQNGFGCFPKTTLVRPLWGSYVTNIIQLFQKSTTSSPEKVAKRCVHFYACICAFASDGPLSEEFAYYIHLDSSFNPEHRFVAIISSGTGQQQEVELEVLPESAALLATATNNALLHDVRLVKKRKKCASRQDTGTTLEVALPNRMVTGNKGQKLFTSLKKQKSSHLEESGVSLDFQHWLGSVTERINQTMHYQFNGHPEPLVFHIPQVFFDCLQHRLSGGAKKKRLPNFTTTFVRKNAVPMGTFSKYTWLINNVLQVKKIFDTSTIPLEVSRSFVKNRDGTFEPYKRLSSEVNDFTESFKKTGNTPLIKPMEYKTFLKVGQTSYSQKELTPFTIEWIPNILPKSQIGELRIKFEYGHQRNGQLDLNLQAPTSFIRIQQLQYS